MERIVIIGTSSTAADIYQFIRKYALYEVLGFAVDKQYLKETSFWGLPVFATEQLDEILDKEKDFVFVAMQWNKLNADRRKVYERLKEKGFRFANLVSPTAIVNGQLRGENCLVFDLVSIEFNTTIGNNVFVKGGAFVGPVTRVADHCFIGAKSVVGGGVELGEQSFVGLGAVVFDDVKIGRKCLVGAATVLKRNLEDCSVYKTSLESYVKKTYTEEEIEEKLLFQKNVRS